jgi:sRNA-binding protein
MHGNPNDEKLFPLHFAEPCNQDDFCIPKDCCPKIIETPKFPSPNSCLPPEETRELEERIDAANRLLLDLGLSGELGIEGRRRAFEGLVGKYVRVNINCAAEEAGGTVPAINISNETAKGNPKRKKKAVRKGGERVKAAARKRRAATPVTVKHRCRKGSQRVRPPVRFIVGYVKLIGQDFVVLMNKGKEFIIRLNNIVKIQSAKSIEPVVNEPDLLDIDPCLRRALTFNFGETVASSPELIHIFYRLTFTLYLLLLQGGKVKVKVGEEAMIGTVVEVEGDTLNLIMKNETIRQIPLETICFVKKLNHA